MKLCIRCNKKVIAKRCDAKFCSAVCRASYRQEQKAEEVKLYKKQYYDINKNKIDSQNMDNYYANKPILEKRNCKQCDIKFQPTRADNEFCNDKCGTAFWRSNNKEYIKEDQNNRYHSDMNRKISTCLRSRLNKALDGNVKSASTMELIGCSIDEFRDHLESQFEPWMSWDNHGNYDPNNKTWQMDHIRPMAAFDLSDSEQQKTVCHYSNVRPILAKNNLIKGDR
jgi:hypothetical protein